MKNKSRNESRFNRIEVTTLLSITKILPEKTHQIISQQLINTDFESLTIFFLDSNEGISTDIQHQDILYFIQKGKVEIIINKVKNVLKENELIFVPSGCPHSISANSASWLMQISIGELPQNKTINGGLIMEEKNYIKNIEKAKVQVLDDLIEYQPNKVASLTLVQKEYFTTTLMAMDKGSGVGPHICEGDAMVVAIDGIGTVMIGEDYFKVKKNECIVMPAGIPHAVKGEEDRFKMMLIVSKPEK